jgi:hypothetical protein
MPTVGWIVLTPFPPQRMRKTPYAAMSLFMAVVDMKTKVNQEFPHLTISERVDVDRSLSPLSRLRFQP